MKKDEILEFLDCNKNEYITNVPFKPRIGWYFIYVYYDGTDVRYMFYDGVDCIEDTSTVNKFVESGVYYYRNKWDFSNVR